MKIWERKQDAGGSGYQTSFGKFQMNGKGVYGEKEYGEDGREREISPLTHFYFRRVNIRTNVRSERNSTKKLSELGNANLKWNFRCVREGSFLLSGMFCKFPLTMPGQLFLLNWAATDSSWNLFIVVITVYFIKCFSI